MSQPAKEPGLSGEPHLRGRIFEPDPSEKRADWNLVLDRIDDEAPDRRVEHSIWNEPGRSTELGGQVPADAHTWQRWLKEQRAKTNFVKTWFHTVWIAACAGPWAVLGVFYHGSQTWFAMLTLVVFAPVMEELMKSAAMLWVIEKRPHWFSNRLQIHVCAFASGLIFAFIENILYLGVYIQNPSPALAAWRWSVCVALHIGCTVIASLGLVRIWHTADAGPPQVSAGASYLMLAAVVHGMYNALAIALSMSGMTF